GSIDAFRRQRTPTANDLLSELKNTARTCAAINAAACASFPPRLYVSTSKDQPTPRCVTKRAVYEHTRRPSASISPSGALSDGERDRLETEWQQRFLRGGQGKALVADEAITVTLLSRSMGDLAALADMKATKEDIANAFGVPLPFLTGETNLANMQAADRLHKSLAILPRLRRRDEKLNEQLVPLFDPSRRLVFASDDPTSANRESELKQEESDLIHGVRTINEVRAGRGLAAVAWGDAPAWKMTTGKREAPVSN